MTATYDITTAVGKVRLVISDTDVTPATDAIFTDEELTYFLGLYSNNVNLAAADALEAWAAKYSTNADSEKMGDYAYTQKIVDKMFKLAARLRETDASTPFQTYGSMNLTGIALEDG